MKVGKAAPEPTAGGGVVRAYLVPAIFLAAVAVRGLAAHDFLNAPGHYSPAASPLVLMPEATFASPP